MTDTIENENNQAHRFQLRHLLTCVIQLFYSQRFRRKACAGRDFLQLSDTKSRFYIAYKAPR